MFLDESIGIEIKEIGKKKIKYYKFNCKCCGVLMLKKKEVVLRSTGFCKECINKFIFWKGSNSYRELNKEDIKK